MKANLALARQAAPEATAADDAASRPSAPPPGTWARYAGAWAVLVAAIGLTFAKDATHLFMTWWDNSTFGHCLLIPPIIAWLVWQRRQGLARLAPIPWLPGAGLMLASAGLWLLGELAGIALFRHAALVFMLQASVPTLFGLAVTRALTFPIFFALFMIPVGEQLVPSLQTVTAQMSLKLLELFGVPAYMDGVFISIPNGDFEVAEACSGIKFLIAMVAFGALVSNVCFKSWQRRVGFMIASVVVPIIANGIRAWGVIYIAWLTTPHFAVGVDHIVYGWFFFAFVMLLLLAIGWRFFDRPVDDPMIEPERYQRPGRRPGTTKALGVASVAAFALAAAGPAYAAYIDFRTAGSATASLVLDPPAGWSRTGYQGRPWRPHYKGAVTAMQSFVDAGGQPVELYVAVFDSQGEGHELVGYHQSVVPPSKPQIWAWASSQPAPKNGSAAQINGWGTSRDVFQYYIVNGKVVGTPTEAKIEGLKAKLFGGPLRAATVVVSAERRDPLVSARPAIEHFVAAMGDPQALVARSITEAK